MNLTLQPLCSIEESWREKNLPTWYRERERGVLQGKIPRLNIACFEAVKELERASDQEKLCRQRAEETNAMTGRKGRRRRERTTERGRRESEKKVHGASTRIRRHIIYTCKIAYPSLSCLLEILSIGILCRFRCWAFKAFVVMSPKKKKEGERKRSKMKKRRPRKKTPAPHGRNWK